MIKYRKSNLKVILLALFGLFMICTSCYQDVIDIDQSDINKQIVIEGTITDQPVPIRVTISEVANIYTNGSIRKISDASVTVSDDNNNSIILSESRPGVYISTEMTGVPGRTYALTVVVEGEEYTAISKMPIPLELDSIQYNLMYPPVPIILYFTDHPGIHDFCRFRIYRNDQYLENEKILYNDYYTDGEIIEIDNIDELYNWNDLLKVELITIDEPIYNYYIGLYSFEDDSDDQTIIDLVSANPKSNISNNALGYFSAQTVRIYSQLIN